MTLPELAALCERAKAIAPGPWVHDDGNIFSCPLSAQRHDVIMRMLQGEDIPHPDDGRDGPLGFVCTTTQNYDGFEEEMERYIAACSPDFISKLVRVAMAAERLRQCDGDLSVKECHHDDLDEALAALKDHHER